MYFLIPLFNTSITFVDLSGKIVSKKGQITGNSYGNTFFVESQVSKNLESDLTHDIQSRFKEYYTIELENYPISDNFIRNPAKINCEADVWHAKIYPTIKKENSKSFTSR